MKLALAAVEKAGPNTHGDFMATLAAAFAEAGDFDRAAGLRSWFWKWSDCRGCPLGGHGAFTSF